MKNIKFVYFDVGNVMNDFSRSFDETTKKFNIPSESFSEFWGEFDDDSTRGKITPDDFWKLAIKKFRLKNAEGFDFADSWANGYVKRRETHDLMKKLVGKYKIGLLTNHYHKMLDLSFKKRVVPNINYDAIVASYEVGYRKPEREIYEIAEEKAKVSPDNILFIDDMPEFVQGAKRQGSQTKWFDMTKIKKVLNDLEKLLLG
ncbi:hypothetical protein B6D29_02735 [Microgenomates bacterium UTCPR1]|nr:MAG: hypothetical protein B6D29_02735 [Microgenomates bacterium UTCPR1]